MSEPRTIDELADWIEEAVCDAGDGRPVNMRVRSRAVVALLQMRHGAAVEIPHLGVCNSADKRQ